MEIYLDISRLCIETAAQKKYESLIRQYFKAKTLDKEKNILEKQINALKYFLEKADFSKLRNFCSNAGSIEIMAVLIVPRQIEDMHVCLNNKTFSVEAFQLLGDKG